MTWPFIARSSHEAIVRLLQEQVSELKAERTVLIDRLGAIGLGGPLFKVPVEPVEEAEAEEEEQTIQDRINEILAQKRRPSLMAQAIKKLARDEQRKPKISWVPSTVAALDAAEAKAKQA